MESSRIAKDAWRLSITGYARVMSGGRWKPYPHLEFAARRVQKAIIKGRGRIIINMPPRHGKSELFSYYLPAWFLDWFPEDKIIHASYSSDHSHDFGRRVRDLLKLNPHSTVKIQADKSAASGWRTDQGGGMTCSGPGGPITGKGGALLIWDDPHKNWEEAMSPTYRERNINWFKSTFYTRGEPRIRDGVKGTIIIIMTRWCKGDMTDYLLNEHPGEWELINLPALAGIDDPLGRAEGEALCEERYSAEELQQLRVDLGPIMFEALYNQNPSPLEGEIFKKHWWNYYKVVPTHFDEIVASWDMSFKETKTGSFVCGHIWGRIGADFYLLPPYEVRERMDYADTKRAVRALHELRPDARRILVEDKANGPAIISDLKRDIPGLTPITPEGSKAARAYSVQPFFESGNVFIPCPELWPKVAEFVEEHARFRGVSGEKNDRVDCTTQAINYFAGKMGRKKNLTRMDIGGLAALTKGSVVLGK